MCGIIGIIGTEPAAPRLLEGLRRLEYRGYDSAGIATVVNGHIDRRRAEGKLDRLATVLDDAPLTGAIGIGHTRWATHGPPTETNAHPHASDRVAVVHNGIIENFQELRAELAELGHIFETQTDTETVVHLLTHYLDEQKSPTEAVSLTLGRLQGAFSLAIVFAGRHDLMVGARRGTPLAVGYGKGETYLASDALALAPLTNQVSYLEDGDWVELSCKGAIVHDVEGKVVDRPVQTSAVTAGMIGKGGHRHFMLKEIYEQPQVVGETLDVYVDPAAHRVALPDLGIDWASVPKVTIVACGTAFFAGLVTKYWLESIARVPVEVDIASEFRYREAPLPAGGVALFVSQSGETLDTLEALRYCRRAGQRSLSVVNVPESTIARESDAVLYTLAGPEIGVASTKAFTTQLAVLACLAVAIARERGEIDREGEEALVTALREVPGRIAGVLNHDATLRDWAHQVAEARDVLYLGRGTSFAIAHEGALKLKEISYIHAEAYAAGEMKHGPIALIDDAVPVIVIAPSDPVFEKTASNVQEVHARNGRVMALCDAKGAEKLSDIADATVIIPAAHPFVAPILYAVPVQLLAYHTAVVKGTDVDQPRNLAKSVTVE
ncbi:MAG: glutamine--fructose-6-phosphate transaminase (isomerizing) [Pseudomonadota bacterium]